MPHKHKRDKSKNEASYDLPPTKTAHPLPVKKSTPTITTKITHSSKRKRTNIQDDTPRAFTRLLNPTTYRPPRAGLDDGTNPRLSKKRKTTTTTKKDPPQPVPPSLTHPKILPHEPLSSFSARVDAALPFSHLPKNSNNSTPKETLERGRQTKTERKMQRMQREWREEERRRKEKMEEEKDGSEKDVDEDDALMTGSRNKKMKKRKRGEEEEEEGDIWAGIKAKRIEIIDAQGGLVGLHNVVQAPPKLVKGKLREKENSNFGKKNGGGLKREGELSEARKGVVEGYRALMRERREGKSQ